MRSKYRTRALCALLADIQNDMFFFHTKEDVPPTVGDSSNQAELISFNPNCPFMLSCKDPPSSKNYCRIFV